MTTVPLMEDNELAKYLPYYGDRLAIKDFCTKETNNKRGSLLEKIRQRYGKSSTANRQKKKNKRNKERLVDLGWHHKTEKGFLQVRTKQGGGTRTVKVEETATKSDILNKAISIFFPEGMSVRFGSISKYEADLWDFKCNKIEETLTVGKIYDMTGLNRLRFYLSTESKKLPATAVRESVEVKQTPVEPNNTSDVVTVFLENELTPHNDDNYIYLSMDDITTDTDFDVDCNRMEDFISFRTNTTSTSSKQLIEDPLNISVNMPVEPTVQFDQGHISSQMQPRRNVETLSITLHRGHVFNELIAIFKGLTLTTNLEVVMVLPNGKKENGFDLGGVYKDALSEFWDSFYNQISLGATFKIPFIRHDMKKDDWAAVAKIFRKGYTDLRYFPIKLGPAFLEYCLFETYQNTLLETFSKYVSDSDWQTLSQARNDFSLVEKEDILEILETLDCKWNPTSENIKQLICDIAHKEIIQKPMFVIDCWQPILQGLLENVNELKTIYDGKKPTAKNIMAILKFSEENAVCGYLKKFIRESGNDTLEKLLRFSTGSDMITDTDLNIEFNSSSGHGRTPVGHTCTSTLELSRQYDNYIDFRFELGEVLKSNIWIMDII